MSDEASGPEDETESLQDWKQRMAFLSGIESSEYEAISKLKFLEVIDPAWRSDEVRIINFRNVPI
jgi:hypothetical protein